MKKDQSYGDLLNFDDNTDLDCVTPQSLQEESYKSELSKKVNPNKRSKLFQEEILHNAIVDCYLQLARATRPEDGFESHLEKEEKRLKKLSNIVLVDYVKGMCELLYSQVRQTQNPESNKQDGENKQHKSQEYEKGMQNLEAQVRSHYSVQNQLKLHIEITEQEHEKEIKELQNSFATEIVSMNEQLRTQQQQAQSKEKELQEVIKELEQKINDLKKKNQSRSIAVQTEIYNLNSSTDQSIYENLNQTKQKHQRQTKQTHDDPLVNLKKIFEVEPNYTATTNQQTLKSIYVSKELTGSQRSGDLQISKSFYNQKYPSSQKNHVDTDYITKNMHTTNRHRNTVRNFSQVFINDHVNLLKQNQGKIESGKKRHSLSNERLVSKVSKKVQQNLIPTTMTNVYVYNNTFSQKVPSVSTNVNIRNHHQRNSQSLEPYQNQTLPSQVIFQNPSPKVIFN